MHASQSPSPPRAHMSHSTNTTQLAANIYATPMTFMESLLECTQFLEKARHDPTSTKDDVLDSLENRLSLLVGKMAAHPTCTAFHLNLAVPNPSQQQQQPRTT